jgi:hypothetical protein
MRAQQRIVAPRRRGYRSILRGRRGLRRRLGVGIGLVRVVWGMGGWIMGLGWGRTLVVESEGGGLVCVHDGAVEGW